MLGQFLDETKEYDFYYKKNKEIHKVTVAINFDEYMDSYEADLYHLSQNYDDKIINEIVDQDKIEFIEDKVREALGHKKSIYLNKSELKRIRDELDHDLNKYMEEFEYE